MATGLGPMPALALPARREMTAIPNTLTAQTLANPAYDRMLEARQNQAPSTAIQAIRDAFNSKVNELRPKATAPAATPPASPQSGQPGSSETAVKTADRPAPLTFGEAEELYWQANPDLAKTWETGSQYRPLASGWEHWMTIPDAEKAARTAAGTGWVGPSGQTGFKRAGYDELMTARNAPSALGEPQVYGFYDSTMQGAGG